MRTLLAAVITLVAFLAAAVAFPPRTAPELKPSEARPGEAGNPGAEASAEEETIPFAAQLRAVARDYEKYEALLAKPRVTPKWCDVVGTDLSAWDRGAPSDPPKNNPIVSESDDGATHGRKHFFLYVADPEAYLDVRTYLDGTAAVQPVGQIVVKAAFNPHRWHAAGKPPLAKGLPKTLFIMFKLDPKTPGTDEGWVYGNLTPDGRVTAGGRVGRCMRCHARRDEPRDRMYGLHADLEAESPAARYGDHR